MSSSRSGFWSNSRYHLDITLVTKHEGVQGFGVTSDRLCRLTNDSVLYADCSGFFLSIHLLLSLPKVKRRIRPTQIIFTWKFLQRFTTLSFTSRDRMITSNNLGTRNGLLNTTPTAPLTITLSCTGVNTKIGILYPMLDSYITVIFRWTIRSYILLVTGGLRAHLRQARNDHNEVEPLGVGCLEQCDSLLTLTDFGGCHSPVHKNRLDRSDKCWCVDSNRSSRLWKWSVQQGFKTDLLLYICPCMFPTRPSIFTLAPLRHRPYRRSTIRAYQTSNLFHRQIECLILPTCREARSDCVMYVMYVM